MEPAARIYPAGKLDGIGFSFTESMSGQIVPGVFGVGAGPVVKTFPDDAVRFDIRVSTADLGRFLRDPRHRATIAGKIWSPRLGGTSELSEGRFEMFSADALTGSRRIVYSFCFSSGGQTYFFRGLKHIRHDPWRFDLLGDMTRLFCTLHRGGDELAPVWGEGILRFRLADGLAFLASMRADGPSSRGLQRAARTAFLSVAWGALRNEYFRAVRLFYETRYENLVLSGLLRHSGSGPACRFFLASGVHDKGFPWGDGELFWDVLLVVSDGSGEFRRYCIADRVLPGLELDVATGLYSYAGPIVRVGVDGVSRSHEKLHADLRFELEPHAGDVVPFPFPCARPSLRHRLSGITTWMWDALPGTSPPGIQIRPHATAVRLGSIRIAPDAGAEPIEDWAADTAGTWGECERGTFRSVRVPKLGYRYRCAVDPETRTATVRVAAGTLRSHFPARTMLGRLVCRIGSAEITLANGTLRVGRTRDGPLPDEIAAPEPMRLILQVSHAQYPTGLFERRIVETRPSVGESRLALEESMAKMSTGPVNSDRSARVASMRHADPLRALECALEASGFDRILEDRLRESGSPRETFLIAIKPNFMFAYDRRDRSTYTDPALVDYLVKRLRDRGFERIQVVESQNTYGEYFDRRSVREMAAYLGYDGGSGYEVVDLTLDVDEGRELGPTLGWHPVPRAWRDAGFRVSFAKNKTHAYAYYTLTLKNVFGALPLANKFKEYHCSRDIYRTTIEYLTAFPVHFGIIDAHVSADGPFGVFANPTPNRTGTIIAGDDLVAVDWVGASRMGLDPMKSRHMQLAVRQFGKPRIEVIGEAGPYPRWRNVPGLLTLLTNRGMDASHRVGDLLYSISAQMDESQFRHKGKAWYVRLLRAATVPIRRLLFLRTTARGVSGTREKAP